MINDLKKIIEDKTEVDYYLGDVTIEQFIKDVKELLKNNSDKSAITEAIKKLQELV